MTPRRAVIACSTVLLLGLVLISSTRTASIAAEPTKSADRTFELKIQPFLKTYCIKCHNADKADGGVQLDHYLSEAHAKKDRKTWDEILRVVVTSEMPKKKAPQPTKADRDFFTNWVENTLLKIDCTGPKDPGRVTIRRLNRVEYSNTIRDLCGIVSKHSDNFPSDDVGYGFDHIGDVLSVQPILMEKYLTAADAILEESIGSLGVVRSQLQKFDPFRLLVIPRNAKTREVNEKGREIRRIILKEEGSAFLEKFNFPADGEYQFRVIAWGKPYEGVSPKLSLRVDGKELQSFTFQSTDRTKPDSLTFKTRITNGEKRVALAFTNPGRAKDSDAARTINIEWLEIEGPIGGANKPLTESMKKILVKLPSESVTDKQAAEATIAAFARRAYRRPVTDAEVTRLMTLYTTATKQGEPFEQAIKLPLKAILVSPHFLFRIEDDPKNPNDVRALNDYELATRLSYFLWSTMPDEELFRVASLGTLRQPEVLKAQLKRMLADPKSVALTDNFAGQWLMLRTIPTLTPDTKTFRSWDEQLRRAVIRETELFFDHIVKEDRSILEFLDANYTFLNDRLSWHYGVPNVRGGDFRKVELNDKRRGGIVTQASVLLVTSNATRTSPVKRGKWVYENILGLTAPPPAPDVPELEKQELKGTLRQRMEQHRANPSCAGCHAKLDPLGFGLENFDGIGKWRDIDEGHKIDASGELPDGSKFSGPQELRKVLLAKSDLFRRCLAEKLLTYALGRGLEFYDKCVVDDLVKKMKSGQDKFSALVLAIVETDAFQKRRGKRSE